MLLNVIFYVSLGVCAFLILKRRKGITLLLEVANMFLLGILSGRKGESCMTWRLVTFLCCVMFYFLSNLSPMTHFPLVIVLMMQPMVNSPSLNLFYLMNHPLSLPLRPSPHPPA